MLGIFAPATSFIIPGSGQLLQGRFDVGLRHASLAILLAAVGVPLGPWVVASFGLLLGWWSSRDAWKWCPAGDSASSQATMRADGAASAGVGSSPRPALPWWRRGLRTALLAALQVVAAAEIAALLVAAGLSGMAFDAPGSDKRLDLWAFVIGINALPLLVVFLCFAAWGLHFRGRTGWAVAILAAIVLVGLAIFGLFFNADSLS